MNQLKPITVNYCNQNREYRILIFESFFIVERKDKAIAIPTKIGIVLKTPEGTVWTKIYVSQHLAQIALSMIIQANICTRVLRRREKALNELLQKAYPNATQEIREQKRKELKLAWRNLTLSQL